MQSIAAYPHRKSLQRRRPLSAFLHWVHVQERTWEENRFTLVGLGILIQVSIAGATVCIPPMAGASIWAIMPGVFFAFISNSIAYAQMKMRWVLLFYGLSILVNASISLYYFMLLITQTTPQ